MSWMGLGVPFGSLLGTFLSALGVFGARFFNFEYLEIILDIFGSHGEHWGASGILF